MKNDDMSIVEEFIRDSRSLTSQRKSIADLKRSKSRYVKKSDKDKVFYCPNCRRVYMLPEYYGREKHVIPEFKPELNRSHATDIRKCGQKDCVKVELLPCGIPKKDRKVCFHNEGENCWECKLNTKGEVHLGHSSIHGINKI